MATKAKLIVVLKADDTVVAESEDPALWQQVLSSIHGGIAIPPLDVKSQASQKSELPAGTTDNAVANFSKRLGLSVEIVTGALSPSREAPYLHLDPHCWSYMKRNTPNRGPGSLTPSGLAATFLALWLKEAKLDVQATVSMTNKVLATINLNDPNAARAIKNTKWLQARSGSVVVINPAEIDKAIEVTQSFCAKKWAGGVSGA